MSTTPKPKTLSQLHKESSEKYTIGSTVGVVVDCTALHRKDVRRDYTMKVKIIDESWSKEPCTVFIYGETLEDFPRIDYIGDVLYLKNYNFDIWNGNLQAKNGNKKKSSCYVISGNPKEKQLEVGASLLRNGISRD